MHVGNVMVFDEPGGRGSSDAPFDYEELVALISAPHRPPAALPPEDARGARAAGQPGLGRRRVVRHHLPRTSGGPAEAGHRRAAARSSSPGSSSGRSTVATRSGRSTSSRGWSTTGSPSSPRRTTRSSTGRSPSTSRSSSSRPTGLRRGRRRHVAAAARAQRPAAGRRGASPTPCSCPVRSIDSVRENVDEAREIARPRRAGPRLAGLDRGPRRRPPGARPHPLNVEIGAGPPFRHGRDRPRRLPQGALAAGPRGLRRRRHHQRRRSSRRRRRVPGLAAHPRRTGPPAARSSGRWSPSASSPSPGRRPRRTGSPPASSTCRSGSPVRRCACTRSPSRCASRWRAARRSSAQRARRAGRVRAADPALARCPARQRDVAPTVQRHHHQRPRPPDDAVCGGRRRCSRPTR